MIRQWPGNVQTYGYCPGCGGRLELHRDRLARLDQLGQEQHLGICGTYCCAMPFGLLARSSAAVPIA